MSPSRTAGPRELSRGTLFQGSCVAVGGRALLIEGASGAGKSALALALIDRGATLVSDDIVSLTSGKDRLVAAPAPNIEGKLEIRNLGIAEFPAISAPVALLITLDENAPRYIEAAEQRELAGISIPAVSLFPETDALPLRAEWALRLYSKRTD